MKKLISLALCLAMVLTIFTINASALVETGTVEGYVPETVYVGQDFSDITNDTDFTTTTGNATITFNERYAKIVTSTLNDPAAEAYEKSGIKCETPITSSNYILEFDYRKDVDTNPSTWVYVYLNDIDCYLNFRPGKSVNNHAWYKIKFVVENNALTYGGYRLLAAESYTPIDLAPASTPQNIAGAQVTYKATEDTGIAFVVNDANLNCSIDNIEVYTPEVEGVFTPYEVAAGNIVHTVKTEATLVPGAESIDADVTVYEEYSSGTQADTKDLVFFVDLMNSGLGMPFSIGATTRGATGYPFSAHILSAASIEDTWYTYKIYYDAVAKQTKAVYRKSANGEWTTLVAGTDYISGVNANRFNAGLKNESYNRVMMGYDSALVDTLATGGSVAGTEWKWKNLQIIDGYAFAGTKTIADGKITLNLNTGIYGAASAILAVYDGEVLADVTPVDLAATAENATVTAAYAEGNDVVLYVWDSLANAKPIMLTPYPVVE